MYRSKISTAVGGRQEGLIKRDVSLFLPLNNQEKARQFLLRTFRSKSHNVSSSMGPEKFYSLILMKRWISIPMFGSGLEYVSQTINPVSLGSINSTRHAADTKAGVPCFSIAALLDNLEDMMFSFSLLVAI